MSITELKAKRAQAWDDAKAFLEAHRDNGVLNAQDEATYNNMVAIVNQYTAEITRSENNAKIDEMMNAVTSAPVVEAIGIEKGETGRGSSEYQQAFHNYITKKQVGNALQEDTDSEGGYLVPTEFERTIVDGLRKTDPIFALAKKITLGAHEKNVPIVASRGAAALVNEEGSYGDTDDTFTQKIFKAYKFGRICKASDELIADSAFNIENYLADSFGYAIGTAAAGYLWTGSGSSQPEGVMSGSAAVTTASSSDITGDEIIDLFYALAEQYRANAVWVMNSSTLATVRKIKDLNGQYIWQAGFGNQPATILGRPVYTSDKIDGFAAGKKVAVFGDFNYYWIGEREGFNFKRLDELYSANGQVGFRGDSRLDGHVMVADAFKILAVKASASV